ncbi:hypothetical protein ACWGI0_18250 [Streptomyces sp. NPDC054802]
MVLDPKVLLLCKDGETYRMPEGEERGEAYSVLETKGAVGDTYVLRRIRVDLPGLPDGVWLHYSPGRRGAAVQVAKKAGLSAVLVAAGWVARQNARNGVVAAQGVIYRRAPVDVKEPSAVSRLAKGGLTVAAMGKDLKNFAKRPVEGYYTEDHTLVVLSSIRATDLKDRYELL